MTQDEIIEMTRQAGGFDATPAFLERFAKLVVQHTLSNIDPSKFMSYQEGFEAGRLAEREACAQVAQDESDWNGDVATIADLIRARGQA
jgi:predicted acylesterase/phospholipase RssA